MPDKSIDPCGLRRCRPADTKPHADIFERPSGMVVQCPVGGLPGLTAPEIKVGLVPNFEIPLADFLDAVALDQMFRQLRDQIIPFTPILWRRDVRFVPKGV